MDIWCDARRVALASTGMSTSAVLLAEHETGLEGATSSGTCARTGSRCSRPPGRLARSTSPSGCSPDRRHRGRARSLPPAPRRRARAHVGPERAGDRADRARRRRRSSAFARSRAAPTTSCRATSTSSCSPASGRCSAARVLGQADVVEAGPLVVDHRARQVRVGDVAVRLAGSRVRARREAGERPAARLHEGGAPPRRLGHPRQRDPDPHGRLARLAAAAQARGRGRRRTSSSTSGAWGTGCCA